MRPLEPMLALPDLGEVIYVIIFLVVAVVNWGINLWKQSRENAERAKQLPSHEEQVARERAWQEQTRPVEAPGPPPLPGGGAPAEAQPTARGGLKELFEELKRAAQEAQNPQPPPQPPPVPHPPVQRHTPPVRTPTPPPPVPVPAAVSSAPRPVLADRMRLPDAAHTHDESARRALAAYQTTEPQGRRKPHPLTALLHTEAGYRQAFVLKEVLDTPVGMRGTPWEEQR